MIKKISQKIAARAKANSTNDVPEEYIAYGTEGLISTSIIVILMGAIGIIFGKFLPSMVYIFSWIILRKFIGGLHAEGHFMCTVISVGLGAASILLNSVVERLPFFVLLSALVLMYVLFFFAAPILSIHKPMSEPYVRKMRTAARIYSALFLAVIALLKWLCVPIATQLFMSYLTTAVLAVMGLFSKNTIKHFGDAAEGRHE